MRHRLLAGALLVLGLGLAPAALAAQEPGPNEQAATRAAEAWLGHLDAGRYAESWNEAAAIFRDAVTVQQWESAARQVLGQTGALVSRTLGEATHTTSLPNAPAGEYVVIRYRSAFQAAPQLVETVIVRREGDADWRVAGYLVGPG